MMPQQLETRAQYLTEKLQYRIGTGTLVHRPLNEFSFAVLQGA